MFISEAGMRGASLKSAENAATTIKRRGEIATEFERLHRTIDVVQDGVSQLMERLAPITCAFPPSDEITKEPEATTAMGNELRAASMRLTRIRLQLGALHDCIEL